MAHRMPPDLFDLFSNLGRERGGTENLVGHWVVGGMKITLVEHWRRTPGQWGPRKELVHWKVTWVPQTEGTVPWVWSWNESEGYKFTLGEHHEEVPLVDQHLLRQWG